MLFIKTIASICHNHLLGLLVILLRFIIKHTLTLLLGLLTINHVDTNTYNVQNIGIHERDICSESFTQLLYKTVFLC